MRKLYTLTHKVYGWVGFLVTGNIKAGLVKCLFNYMQNVLLSVSAGRYTGSYRIPVFIFLTIWIFKIPQYRCHLNNVLNAALLERGLFSLLHFGEDTAVCVTKRESSETEALVECDEREEVMHNIHIDRHKYPPSAASAPTSLTHNSSPAIRRIPVNCRVPAFLNSLFIILRP